MPGTRGDEPIEYFCYDCKQVFSDYQTWGGDAICPICGSAEIAPLAEELDEAPTEELLLPLFDAEDEVPELLTGELDPEAL